MATNKEFNAKNGLSIAGTATIDSNRNWLGEVIPVTKGGTALTAAVQGAVLYGSSTSATAFSAAGTSGQYLKSTGTTAPVWQTLSLPDMPDAYIKGSVAVATTGDLGAASFATGVLTGKDDSFTLAIGTTSGSTTVTTTATAGIAVGAGVTASSLSGGTTVASITNATTFEINQVATATSVPTVTGTFTQTIAALAIDGYTLGSNDRVLVKDQTSALQNGIYYLTTLGTTSIPWVLTRATDADTTAELAVATVAVDRGTINTGKVFKTAFSSTATINTSPVTFGRMFDSLGINGTETIMNTTSSGSTSPFGRTVVNLAEYFNQTATGTGCIVFVGPTAPAAVMHQFEVEALLYNQNIAKFTIQGYRALADGAWTALRKVDHGTVSLQTRWGATPGGLPCLILGDVATVWSFPHVTISKALFSHTGVTDAYCRGWTVALVADLTGYTTVTSDITSSTVAVDAATVDGKSFGTFAAAGGVAYATSTTALAATAAGTTGQFLLSGATGAPTWSNTVPNTITSTLTTPGTNISLASATSNLILFNVNGLGDPTVTTRSVGTKIVFYPNITGSAVDYAMGVSVGTLWSSVANTSNSFEWYGSTTLAATLTGTGNLTTVGTVTGQKLLTSATTVATAPLSIINSTINFASTVQQVAAAIQPVQASSVSTGTIYNILSIPRLDGGSGLTHASVIGVYSRVDALSTFAGTVTSANAFRAGGMAMGAGNNWAAGTLETYYAFHADNHDGSMTSAAKTFSSTVSRAANRHNLYLSGDARNYISGRTGIGVDPTNDSNALLHISGNTATTLVGASPSTSKTLVHINPTFDAAVTGLSSAGVGVHVESSTVAATMTMNELRCFNAAQGTFGAGSAVTNQIGFYAASTLTGAANNYGFFANIAAANNVWGFYGNGTARNYFKGGVEVQAGTTTMTSGFSHVSAAAGVPTGVPTNPTGNVPLYFNTTADKLYAYDAGWIECGGGGSGVTTATANTIAGRDANADLYAVNFISSSDERLKKDIKPITGALDIVGMLEGVTFAFKNTDEKSAGLIAQEVEQVLPDIVKTDPETGMKSVNYLAIIGYLIEAIKELKDGR